MDASKKCRICGTVRPTNILIFEEPELSVKINTVYPIILTANDPLPKGICGSCHRNVITLHKNIERTMELQKNWINSLRELKPNHNYVKVIDLIENSNKITKESVKKILGDDVLESSINRQLLSTFATTTHNQHENGNLQTPTFTPNQYEQGNLQTPTTQNAKPAVKSETVILPTNAAAQSLNKVDPMLFLKFKPRDVSQKIYVLKKPPANSAAAKLQEPQTTSAAARMAEPNHDPMLKFKPKDVSQKMYVLKKPPTTSAAAKLQEPPTTSAAAKLQEPPTTSAAAAKMAEPNHVTQNLVVNPLRKSLKRPATEEPTTSNAAKSSSPDSKKLCIATQDSSKVMHFWTPLHLASHDCSRCTATFDSAQKLYEHNLTHLKLKLKRLDDSKTLPKEYRRGQISVKNADGSVKYIRCSNCWRAFLDKRSIIVHWALSECDFYCLICKQDFSHSPKLLREHMINVHGVTHKSISSIFGKVSEAAPNEKQENLQIISHKDNSENPLAQHGVTFQAATSGKLKCYICDEVFTNDDRTFRAHMQLHNTTNYTISHTPSKVNTNNLSNSTSIESVSTKLDHVVKININDKTARVVKKPETSIAAATTSTAALPKTPLPIVPVALTATSSNSPNSTRSVIRGVRTKYVQPRTDLQKANLNLTAPNPTSSTFSITTKQFLTPRPNYPTNTSKPTLTSTQAQPTGAISTVRAPPPVVSRPPTGTITVRPTATLLGRPVPVSLARSTLVNPLSNTASPFNRKTTVITTHKTITSSVAKNANSSTNLTSRPGATTITTATTTSLPASIPHYTVKIPTQPCHSTIKSEPIEKNATASK